MARLLPPAFFAVCAFGCIVPSLAVARDHRSSEQQLADMLKDRVAGKPVDCISQIDIRGTTVIDGLGIVYDTGSTLYVNRPKYPESLNSDQILVTKTWTDQLCRLDTVELRDRGSRMYDGFVGLEDFVPYTKPAKTAAR